jgi:hypothetical protein
VIGRPTAITVWARAAGRCSLPECRIDLTDSFNSRALIGNLAHIVGRNQDGPRGRHPIADTNRNTASNLILLCPNHHSAVDANVSDYTVDILTKLKREHEEWVARTLRLGSPHRIDVGELIYLNVPKFILDSASYRHVSTNDFGLPDVEDFQSLNMMERGQLIAFCERILKKTKFKSLTAEQIADIGRDYIGARVCVRGNFYTKGLPLLDKPFAAKGDLKSDPHIHCRAGARQIIAGIDPRWITSLTAYGWLRGRYIPVTLLGTIRGVTVDQVVVSPFVIGLPPNPFDTIK